MRQGGKRNITSTEIQILRAQDLSEIPWLVHGFSTRLGGVSHAYGKGDLNLDFTKEDSRAAVESNRAAFLDQLAGDRQKERKCQGTLITLRQVHSDIIHCVSSAPRESLTGDGLVTATPSLLTAIQTADCLPIMLVDTRNRAVGVFHAGWRGTLKRIVEKGAGMMRHQFGTRPRDVKAAIGPGIHGCCYEIGEDVREKFESQFPYAANLFREVKDSDPVREKYPLMFLSARAPGHSMLPKKIFLDLVEANRRQLLGTGVPASSIWASELCTSCRTDLLFSYRGQKGKTGRLMGVAGIRG